MSIAALTGQAYAFYLPFIRRPEEAMSGGEGKGGEDDDTEGVGAGMWKDQPPSQEEMLAWMAEFPREYDDSMARRRMMGRVGVAALRRYHRACTLVRAELVLTMGAIRSETVTDLWVSPGVGVIAESAARVSSVMGVPVRRSRSVRRLEGWLEAPVDRVSARDDDRASRPGGR